MNSGWGWYTTTLSFFSIGLQDAPMHIQNTPQQQRTNPNEELTINGKNTFHHGQVLITLLSVSFKIINTIWMTPTTDTEQLALVFLFLSSGILKL